MNQRFPLRMGPVFAAGRIFSFAKSATSYVDVGENGITARMGWFRLKLRSADIGLIEKQEWPWTFFSGWTIWWVTGWIVFGSPGELVYLEIRQPVWTFRTGVPMRVRRVYLSAEDVGGLIAAIESTKRHSRADRHRA